MFNSPMPEETFHWAVTVGVAIATLCILTMAVVSVLLYRVMSKFRVRIDDVTARVEPLIETVRKLADDNAPKISALTSNMVEISANAKDVSIVANDQAHRFAEVGRDLADRVKAQIARVDAVVDDTVEQVHNAGDNVKAAVMKPVREASAVLAGVRAAVTTLVDGRRPTVDHITQDEEMFI
jgi:methyl-accepting chemotaxis protein